MTQQVLSTDTITGYLHPTKGWRKGILRMNKRLPIAVKVKRIDGSTATIGIVDPKKTKTPTFTVQPQA